MPIRHEKVTVFKQFYGVKKCKIDLERVNTTY